MSLQGLRRTLRPARLAVERSRRHWAPLWRLVPRLAAIALLRRPTVVVTYDLRHCPATFGDYLYVLMVARLLQAVGAHTDIVVVEGLREDSEGWESLAKERIDEYERLCAALSIPGRYRFREVGGNELESLLDASKGAVLYPPRRALRRGVPWYRGAFRDLEVGLALVPRRVRDAFVLRGAEVATLAGVEPPARPYFLVAVRTASLYRSSSDIGPDEVTQQVEGIRQRFPGAAIVLASDARGTEAMRSWPLGDVHFAQDLGRTFVSNLVMALCAHAYVQIRGGGLFIGPLFSDVPTYLCVIPVAEFPPERIERQPLRFGWGDRRSRWVWRPEDPWSELARFLDELAAAEAT